MPGGSPPDGRTRAYVQGRSVSANDLRAVASRLITFYGQHEHRRLVLASAQLEILDAFCGKAHLENCARFEQLLAGARRIERELDDLRERMGARERDLDLLEFELNEIDAAAPSESEEVELEAERKRLAAVETLMQAGWAAASALDPKGDDDSGRCGRLRWRRPQPEIAPHGRRRSAPRRAGRALQRARLRGPGDRA